ncbi:MAG: YcxB family protein [Bacteroidota bacterium]
MKHTITLTENDYLTHQLYEASTNPIRRSRRNRSYIFIVVCLVICTFGSSTGDRIGFYVVAAVTAAAILFGKQYFRWRYKKHYARHVRTTYKGFFDQPVEIEINEETIRTASKTGETTTKISEINQVSEIPNHFLITISTGDQMIIPKSTPALNEEIIQLARREHILFLDEKDWKWN